MRRVLRSPLPVLAAVDGVEQLVAQGVPVRALVRDRSPAYVVLQCEAVTDIDVTAAEVLKDLDDDGDLDWLATGIVMGYRPGGGVPGVLAAILLAVFTGWAIAPESIWP